MTRFCLFLYIHPANKVLVYKGITCLSIHLSSLHMFCVFFENMFDISVIFKEVDHHQISVLTFLSCVQSVYPVTRAITCQPLTAFVVNICMDKIFSVSNTMYIQNTTIKTFVLFTAVSLEH